MPGQLPASSTTQSQISLAHSLRSFELSEITERLLACFDFLRRRNQNKYSARLRRDINFNVAPHTIATPAIAGWQLELNPPLRDSAQIL